MSNYNVNVNTIKAPTGEKYIILAVNLADGDITFAVTLQPLHAVALADSLMAAAAAAERIIEIPGESFAGLKVSDLTKGD